MSAFIRAPLSDYLAALERLLPVLRWWHAVVALAAAGISWVVYVPLHELGHAFGCLWSGGTVTRLEIDALYGAVWLAKVFPFVVVGSDYAGQLTGFDTGGSDLVYLATDFAPFLMTIVVGVPLLRGVPRVDNPNIAAAMLGAAIPVAYAPFISLPGDYYEMGSILVSRLAAGFVGVPRERWRSDDVFLLVEQLREADGGTADWLAVGAAAVLGLALALATYSAGAWVASALWSRRGESAKISGEGTSV